MVKFKSSEVKSVGKVQISAKKLKELADKLQEVRGTDSNEVVEVFIVPGKAEGEVAQLAFDFSKSEVKTDVQPEEKKEAVVDNKDEAVTIPEEKSAEEESSKEENAVEVKKQESVENEVKEETKEDVTAPTVEKPETENKEVPEQKVESEVDKIINNEELAQKAKEINQEAYKNTK